VLGATDVGVELDDRASLPGVEEMGTSTPLVACSFRAAPPIRVDSDGDGVTSPPMGLTYNGRMLTLPL
jgi:hypothetical protein